MSHDRRRAALTLDPVPREPAIDLAPPVTPNLVRRPELARRAERGVGRNTIETILFRGLSTPTALLFVVLQGRFLEPEGRGEFVVVVLGATIVSRLLGQLGVAVTSRADDEAQPVPALVRRALALGVALGVVGTAATTPARRSARSDAFAISRDASRSSPACTVGAVTAVAIACGTSHIDSTDCIAIE